jgi:hypothetical protein
MIAHSPNVRKPLVPSRSSISSATRSPNCLHTCGNSQRPGCDASRVVMQHSHDGRVVEVDRFTIGPLGKLGMGVRK